MCGIAGILELDSAARPSMDTLHRMAKTLSHRGSDGEDFYHSGPVGLAHRRLSIIDLISGQQPMSNDDKSLWITFNGEIFNYVELRNELQKTGCRFRTESDTEVILHMYEEKGEECVRYFNGQWAFA